MSTPSTAQQAELRPVLKAGPIPIAIVGASGYTGGELLRLLQGHSTMRPVLATSRTENGQPVRSLFPGLNSDLLFSQPDLDVIAEKSALAFVCLPHGAAGETAAGLRQRGIKVVDLSADLRFADLALYQRTYGLEPSPLAGAVPYGLTEWNRAAISGGDLIANPGCYVTASLMALLPLVEAGVLSGPCIIDAKSGVSGAGRTLRNSFLHAELTENFAPYASWGHRHEAEISHRLETLGGHQTQVVFSPHLLPVARGILASIYCRITVPEARVREIFQDRYSREPFVRMLPAKQLPSVRAVTGSNRIDMQLVYRPDQDCWILFSALDNLTKGASGQAIQNANLMLGLAETDGLPLTSTWL